MPPKERDYDSDLYDCIFDLFKFRKMRLGNICLHISLPCWNSLNVFVAWGVPATPFYS